ncbi:YIP1 family protein [Edaphobacter sp.]|uniref:YIP1 family protein n=1 Tax=Edaphobacter sp. TaxID=1934404 RepID=UPI002DBBD986|nr:YIP1 family protein [Edaphobacter sp.]HEU5342476.1 YIP1 family protein [Edaphobacter sp.]
MSDDAIVGEQAAGTGLSQVERVVDTFIAPSKTFTDILRNRSVWLPIVLSIIFSLATAWTMQKKVGFSQMYQMSLAQNPSQQEQFDAKTPDQRAAQMRIGTAITEGISYGYWAIGLIFAAIAALVLWGSFNFLAGAKTGFSEMFAVWIYAGLTGLVGAVLIIIMLVATGGDNFNVQDPIGTNLGYFLGGDSAHWLKSLLGSFDLLVFWFMALLIIGTSIVAKVKRSTAAAIIIGWWALLVVVKTAFAALMS